jgi:SLT domain-containing protein
VGDFWNIARVSREDIVVHIRWCVPSDKNGIALDQYRAIAVGGIPSESDWILTAVQECRRVVIPTEIREWAATEVQLLYQAFTRLE